MLEAKGVEAKGLDVAQSRLQAHLAKAATIVTKEKEKGKDVSVLAQELDENLKEPKSLLAQSFKEQKRELKQQEDTLEDQLEAAHLAGDIALEEQVAGQLGQVKAQLELLKLRKKDVEEKIEEEEDRIEEEMEDEEEAAEAIEEAKEEKQEVIEEATEERIELSGTAFAQFDGLLVQAKNAFADGNYKEAEKLARQAEDSLEDVEDMIDELEDAMDDDDEGEEENEDAEDQEDEDNGDKAQGKSERLVVLVSQNNSGESGEATLKAESGKIKVKLDLKGAPDSPQPAHIHTGSCENLGAVKYPLTSPVEGESETMLDVTLSQLLSELPLAVNVHKSSDEVSVYAACGDITS